MASESQFAGEFRLPHEETAEERRIRLERGKKALAGFFNKINTTGRIPNEVRQYDDRRTRVPRKPTLFEQILDVRLTSKEWKALYTLTIKRIAKRDKEFADALAKEFLSLAGAFHLLHGHAGICCVVPEPGESERDARIEEWINARLSVRLNRKRDNSDSLEFLHGEYRTLYEFLLRVPRAKWRSFAQKYWRLLKREGSVPKNVKEQLSATLNHIRGARTAALEVLKVIHGRASRESLRVQFRDAGFKLR